MLENRLQALPELRPYLHDKSGRPVWGVTFATNGSGLRLRLTPDFPRPETEPLRVNNRRIDIARLAFVKFLLIEHRESLAGPCQWKHCGKYWLLKKGKLRPSYCSRQCCQRASATEYTRRRLEKERADKLERAEKAARRWRTARTKNDWKIFVLKQEPDITSKFLTRAVNKGELKPPTKGS